MAEELVPLSCAGCGARDFYSAHRIDVPRGAAVDWRVDPAGSVVVVVTLGDVAVVTPVPEPVFCGGCQLQALPAAVLRRHRARR
ncbi:MAG: hypothetical protein R2737_09830 [Candidatus Nanopelagicales bacterium]